MLRQLTKRLSKSQRRFNIGKPVVASATKSRITNDERSWTGIKIDQDRVEEGQANLVRVVARTKWQLQ